MQQFLKDNWLTVFGIGTTIIYIGLIVYLRWSSFSSLSEMPLNELGDFCAGVFGPLMLLWLILGFFQQQKELRQNTRALELQADELKKSVEQHKELVNATKDQAKIEIQSIEIEKAKEQRKNSPYLIILESKINKLRNGTGFRISLKIQNTGATASNVNFVTDLIDKEFGSDLTHKQIPQNDTCSVYWDLERREKLSLPEKFELFVNYRNHAGQAGGEKFTLVRDSELPQYLAYKEYE